MNAILLGSDTPKLAARWLIRFLAVCSIGLGLVSCNRQELGATAPNSADQVAIAPRFVSASGATVPSVAKMRFSLSSAGLSGSYKVTEVDYVKNGDVVVGSVTVGSDYSLTALGFDTASGSEIPRFWGSAIGTAGTAADAKVTVNLVTGPADPAGSVSPDSLKVGSSLPLSAGMWFSLDGSDPRRIGKGTAASGSYTVTSAGMVKVATKLAADGSTGRPDLWSGVSSWTFTATGGGTTTNSEFGIPWQTGITYGSVTDAAGQSYKTVKIGSQWWMAENLNYAGTSGTVGGCYGSSADSCKKYGRLYTWAEVMNGASSSATSPSGVQGVCPTGWHVPSDAEWTAMTDYIGGASAGGTKLKSTSGWINGWNSSGNGTDTYGFRALPGGGRISAGYLYSTGYYGYWWSATEHDDSSAWSPKMYYSLANVTRDYNSKTYGFSLRCLQDDQATISTTTAHDSTLATFTLDGTTVNGFVAGKAGAGSRVYVDSVASGATCARLAATATESGSTISDTGAVSLNSTD